jgi:phosphomannomutase
VSEPIISVSGLRGIIGDQLTPLVAMRYVAALASSLGAGEVVVGRDGRASGEMLFQTIASTLVGHGMTVIDLGVAATPTVGVAVREYGATAGIQISASHNPRQYNGLKLFAGSGRVLSKATGERVLASYQEGRSRWQGIDHLGKQMTVADPHARHLELVLDTVNVDLIRSRRFKVLLDSNCGAGSLLGRRLLDSLGCEVTILGDRPDGQFEHPPEPLAANLQAVCQRAIESGADITFCQDPDADRLAIIDQQGNYIGEEMTLALCLLSVLPQSPGPIVTAVSRNIWPDISASPTTSRLSAKPTSSTRCCIARRFLAARATEGRSTRASGWCETALSAWLACWNCWPNARCRSARSWRRCLR